MTEKKQKQRWKWVSDQRWPIKKLPITENDNKKMVTWAGNKTQPPRWRRGEAPSNPEFPCSSGSRHICISIHLYACIFLDSCILNQDEQQLFSDLLISQSFETWSSCLLLYQMLTYMYQNRVNCSFFLSLIIHSFIHPIIWFPFKRSRNFQIIFKFSLSYKSQKSIIFVGKCAQISISLPQNFVVVQKA